MKKLFIVCVAILSYGLSTLQTDSLIVQAKTPSQNYVEAMGNGWNLGNSFDGFDDNNDRGEESWGNPRVTRELITTVRQKGFDSIRLPFTAHMRIDGPENDFQIDEEFLNRYEEIVNWSLEEDLYVMINLHHDSWIWLADWDGDTEAEDYLKFVRIWEQLADRFKDYDERLMFESINEPQFYTDEASAMTYLQILNDTFYDSVRSSGGNNDKRMLVLPTLLTDAAQDKLDALYNHILELDDENLIATIHYYSEWIYSANLGKTRFDGILWDDDTPRTSLVDVFDRIAGTFTDNGVGVVIGEYGLLGYDKSETVNQFGETLKFLEFINYYARQNKMTLMLWDNGQHLNRHNYEWHNTGFGTMIEESMDGRSSYATELNINYLTEFVPEGGLSIPLTLNGNEFVSIYHDETPLIQDEDYTYESETVHLSEHFLTYAYNQTNGETGTEIPLVIEFSSGANWHQTLIYIESPELDTVEAPVGERINIPAEYNGNHLESVTSKDENGAVVSNNDWWDFLESGHEFIPDYEEGFIRLSPEYTQLLTDGMFELTFTFFSGEVIEYQLIVADGTVKGNVVTEETDESNDSTDNESDPDEITEEDNNEDNEEDDTEDNLDDDDLNDPGTETDQDIETDSDLKEAQQEAEGTKAGESEHDDEKISDTDYRFTDTEETDEEERLPETATSIWTIGVIGTSLLACGVKAAYYNRKKR